MKGIAFLVLLLVSTIAKADTIDSLYLHIRHDVKGHLKEVNMLMTQLDAQGWADTLVTFTQKDKTERIEATLALYMAYSCYDRGMYVMSDELAQQVVVLSDKLDDQEMKSDALSHLSTTLFREGKLEEAIRQTIVGLHIDSLLQDPVRLSSSYNNIAAFCQAAGHHEEAEQYILKSISIEESLENPEKLSIRYGIASEIYTSLLQYDKALEYITQAYDLDRKAGKKVGAARRQSQMGDIYLAQKDYKAAERLYTSALQTLRSEQEPTSLVITLKQISKVYAEQGEWDKCLDVLLQSDSLVRRMGGKYQLAQIVRLEAEAYKNKEQWEEAEMCYEEALRLNEDVHNDKLAQLTAEYSSRFRWMEMEKEQTEDAGNQHSRLKGIILVILLAVLLAEGVMYVRLWRKGKTRAPIASPISAEDSMELHETDRSTPPHQCYYRGNAEDPLACRQRQMLSLR